MGNEDLGHFFYDTGDYSNAQKAYMKMREHCTSNKHRLAKGGSLGQRRSRLRWSLRTRLYGS
jgi:hypothetical protein